MPFSIVLISIVVFGALILAASANSQEPAPKEADKKEAPKPEAQKCLDCHKSFDKIAADTADYTTPSGETTTPHRYIPHAEKKDIPECTECHKPHPVPLKSKEEAVKPDNIDFCYSSCHHAHNLQPCNSCH
jgi:hypothetical protein